jgi:DNA-binding response OmpR family regulator
MKILVVEDEKKVAGFIKRGLEEDDDYQVSIVDNGEDGLKLALTGEYCLVTSGVTMPKKDGFTLLKELREAGSTIPVMMLTAHGTTEEIVCGLEAGADDYLTKPFAFAELLSRVRALLRRKQRNRGSVDTHRRPAT